MQPAGELVGERRIDHAVRLEPGVLPRNASAAIFTRKCVSPSGPVAGVTLVQVGLVHHFERGRTEKPRLISA